MTDSTNTTNPSVVPPWPHNPMERYIMSQISRRSFVAGVSLTSLAGAAGTSPAVASDPHEQVRAAAEALAAAMQAVHGGSWDVFLNHNSKMAAVSKSARGRSGNSVSRWRVVREDGEVREF